MTAEQVTGEQTGQVEAVDEFERGRARSASGLLAELNHPEGLNAADVHVARRLAALGRCDDEPVLVAAALAVRAVRQGSVCLDLDSPRVAALLADRAWEVAPWRERLLASPLVRQSGEPAVTPLVLDEQRLYLDRYWNEEGQVVHDLRRRGATAPTRTEGLAAVLDRYYPSGEHDDFADQRAAVEAACLGWTTVVTGGPGTGKTTTIARLLGVLLETEPQLRVALAAPTGRAAARLGEAVTGAAAEPSFPTGPITDRIAEVATTARTLHRLLGAQPGRGFRHDRTNRLPYDVVVVDETSMVSLTMMARLLEAMRPQARLVLVGDSDQLASVDAGAVLGDLVTGLGEGSPAAQVRRLARSRRFGATIGALAEAIRTGDAEETLRLLTEDPVPERREEADGAGVVGLVERIEEVEGLLVGHAQRLREVAAHGEPSALLEVLEEHRLLCAHREGPHGAGFWNCRIERALADADRRAMLGTWYIGRPLIVTENDYGLGLYNGDLGVVVPAADAERSGMDVVLASGAGEVRRLAVGRLSEVRSAHAMTVHRSQGSQVREVTVLLPDATSPLLTRQLLYTAVTRATQRVRVVGSEDAVRAAVGTNVPRASGLAERLSPRWATSSEPGPGGAPCARSRRPHVL